MTSLLRNSPGRRRTTPPGDEPSVALFPEMGEAAGLALRSAIPRVREGGMTLLELILVMIILFTIAAVAAPRLSDSFPSLQVRKSADQVFSWARKARADAALTGARQRLVFNPEKRKYWLAYEARPLKEPGKFTIATGAWTEETLPGEVVFESLEGAQEDPDSKEARYLEFRPDGTCTDATIILANDRGDRQTIKVVGASSRVTMEEVKP